MSMGDRPYWNMEIEPLLNTPEMEKIQLEKLKKMLGRLKDNSPFYGKMMDGYNFDPETLSSFEEFKEKIDPFDKQSLRDLVASCEGDLIKALDQLMPIRVEELDYISTTTGTTGVPTPYPMTNKDIEMLWGEMLARGAWRAGVRPQDRVLFEAM